MYRQIKKDTNVLQRRVKRKNYFILISCNRINTSIKCAAF